VVRCGKVRRRRSACGGCRWPAAVPVAPWRKGGGEPLVNRKTEGVRAVFTVNGGYNGAPALGFGQTATHEEEEVVSCFEAAEGRAGKENGDGALNGSFVLRRGRGGTTRPRRRRTTTCARAR
jgi:hypothetical protein